MTLSNRLPHFIPNTQDASSFYQQRLHRQQRPQRWRSAFLRVGSSVRKALSCVTTFLGILVVALMASPLFHLSDESLLSESVSKWLSSVEADATYRSRGARNQKSRLPKTPPARSHNLRAIHTTARVSQMLCSQTRSRLVGNNCHQRDSTK